MIHIKKIKNFISDCSNFFKSIINEVFILTGLFLIVYATYRINTIAALYLLGIVFILFGLFLAITRRE